MADISDAENAIKAALETVIYPGGKTQPSVVGTIVSIFRGWPSETVLNATLLAGECVISIFPKAGHDRDGPLVIGGLWRQGAPPVVTIAASVAGNVVTFAGTPAAGQLAVVISRGIGFSYAVQAGDGLSDIALNLAVDIASDGRLNATSSGATLAVTLPVGNIPVAAVTRVGGLGTVWREVARRETILTVTCWAPTPAARDQLGAIVDVLIGSTDYLTASDSTAIKTELAQLRVTDISENANLYRRDRDVLIQYSIVQTAMAEQMLLPNGQVSVMGISIAPSLVSSTVVELNQGGNIAVDASGTALVQSLGTGQQSISVESLVAEVATRVAAENSAALPAITGAASLVYQQNTPSTVWDIVHGLGSFPAIVIVDSAGNEVEGDVRYVSANEVVVSFAAACSGTAYLN